MTSEPVLIYCDGSGQSSGGAGGCGYVAIIGDFVFEGSIGLASATNQQAEILAAAYALDQIDPAEEVHVWSDSEYVVKGWNEWLANWRGRGWRTMSGKVVKNQPHWRRLIVAAERHKVVKFQWLPGHEGHEWNERADDLAGAARRDIIEGVDQ